MSLLHKQIERFNGTNPELLWINEFGEILNKTKVQVRLGDYQFIKIGGDSLLEIPGAYSSLLHMIFFNFTSNRKLILQLKKIAPWSICYIIRK